ncbi:MAG: formylglycine-generating enzyme family protein, partial [Planctomycetota bacterium]
MGRESMFLALIISLLALVTGATGQYLNVPEGTTYTVTGSETYDDFDVAGTLIIESSGSLINVGQGGDGYITINGGTFTVTNDFKFPDDPGGVHRMYLNDGTMRSWNIQLYYSRDAMIYVGGGILRLDNVTPGSDEYDPAQWLLQGALRPAEGYDEVVIEYIPAGPYTQVRAIRYDPNIAWRPRPADNATNVAPDANLGWSRGDNADSHDVYWGTSYTDVENATKSSSQYKGNREPNSCEPNSILELGRTYYWRIDEVNNTSDTTWKGNVWSFTVDEGKASAPSPGDGEGGIAADVNLHWTPGVLASWHEVYLGTNFNEVSNALDPNIPPGTGRRFTNSYNPPGELDLYTTYYWRVDEGSAKTFVKGDVWSFRVVDTFVNSVGMFFVGVEPGSFLMGSEQGDFDEKPMHNVTISQGFYMSKYEVTNAQYEQFDPDHVLVDHRGFAHEPDEAVIFVSWEDANAFCGWLSRQEGQPYRLPTEAEWEFACRA